MLAKSKVSSAPSDEASSCALSLARRSARSLGEVDPLLPVDRVGAVGVNRHRQSTSLVVCDPEQPAGVAGQHQLLVVLAQAQRGDVLGGPVGAHVERPVGAEQHVSGARRTRPGRPAPPDRASGCRSTARAAGRPAPPRCQHALPAGPRRRGAVGRAAPSSAPPPWASRTLRPGWRASTPLGHELGGGDGGLDRVADGVPQVVAVKRGQAEPSRCRMHEYHGARVGGGRPERREPVVAEIAAADAGRYLDAPQPRQRHEVLKLGHGQRGDPEAGRRRVRARGRRVRLPRPAPGSRSGPGRSGPRAPARRGPGRAGSTVTAADG